jgi:hypothetical protein
MSAMVWVLLVYSQVTVTLLTVTEGIPVYLGMLYALLVTMALSCHAKTSLTDPGSVPITAIPSERQRLTKDSHSMCGQCQTFKPPGSHHCRICNRCISHMDHHCPWMNNCVGVGNLKHFLLFLTYTWTASSFALGLFGWNYFFCADEDCTFHPVVLHLVRVMTLLAIGAFLFTSSMLMNVCYGVMTGIGTIDRLKKKATNTMAQSDEEPINLIDVSWWLVVDKSFGRVDTTGRACATFRLLLVPRIVSHRYCSAHRFSALPLGTRGPYPWTPSLKTTIASWAIHFRKDWIGNGNWWRPSGPFIRKFAIRPRRMFPSVSTTYCPCNSFI